MKIGQTGTSLRASYRSRDALQRDIVGCGATGRQICPNFGFWLIFPMQNPYNVPSGNQPKPRGYIAE